MQDIVSFEADATLNALLDRLEQGEEVVITRGGKRVARLVPDRDERDTEAAHQAVERIIARRKGVTLGGLKIKDLINEGRR